MREREKGRISVSKWRNKENKEIQRDRQRGTATGRLIARDEEEESGYREERNAARLREDQTEGTKTKRDGEKRSWSGKRKKTKKQAARERERGKDAAPS